MTILGETGMKNIIFHVIEYALAFLFIRGGISVFFLATPPLDVPSALTLLVGALAIDIYGVLFFLTGVALVISKWLKRRKVHKASLFIMWLTCVYVLVLSIALSGLSWDLWLTVVCALASAVAWLRWKINTDYLDPEELIKMTAYRDKGRR